MKKKIYNKSVIYYIMWSPLYTYDRFSASRILPELPGLLCIMEDTPGDPGYLLFYNCWREGLRHGLRIFFDPMFSKLPAIRDSIKDRTLLYKYTVIDSNPLDMKDIMCLLIMKYQPAFNDLQNFSDSGRHDDISLNEMNMKAGETIERFPQIL